MRGAGLTSSERYLVALADRSFLKLWSYPNSFSDRGLDTVSIGKEIADLLVVCGNDVLIFSDKFCKWPAIDDVNLAWSRWYRHAIGKSISQIKGAERWLLEHPDRIYLDPKCTMPFPIDFPSPETIRVHRIVLANGATEACQRYCNDDSGSFIINALLKGGDHTDSAAVGFRPFVIGDVNPSGPYMHVFDRSALSILMKNMDTISDFTRYLSEREILMRSGRFFIAPGEEDLLAFYMQNSAKFHEETFIPSTMKLKDEFALISISTEGRYFFISEQYKAKREADRVSYFWDGLISIFTDAIIDGTTVALLGESPSAMLSERGLRIMARETRFRRRLLGRELRNAITKARELKYDRFVRRMLPDRSMPEAAGYLFLIVPYPNDVEVIKNYEDYRRARASMLETYCFDFFDRVPDLSLIIGVAMDGTSDATRRYGGSEELIAVERPEWTDELRVMLRKAREVLEIRPFEEGDATRVDDLEYPVGFEPSLNRRQRRAGELAARRLAAKNAWKSRGN